MKQQPILQTERLILRPFDLSDAKDTQRLVGDKAVADTTLNIPHPYEDGMAEQWISTHQPQFDEGNLCTLAITLRDTGELIGAIALTINSRFERAELGYWIGKPYWNKGYCTEAGVVVLKYGFAVLGLHRIHATHFGRNPASGRVMQKLGMKHEGRAREHAKRGDRFEDLESYGILKEEWE